MTQQDRKFNCGKCGHKPHEWDRLPEKDFADAACPRCGKDHLHIKNQVKNEYVPVDEEEEEFQNIFVLPTGRKIHGFDRVKSLIRQTSSQKFCKNCGAKKSSGWKYSSGNIFDVECPECSQKHKEEPGKLIRVDDAGNMLPVLTGSDGETLPGEDVQDGLNKLKDTRGEQS
mgnify:FL=1